MSNEVTCQHCGRLLFTYDAVKRSVKVPDDLTLKVLPDKKLAAQCKCGAVESYPELAILKEF